ncbi:MAG: hypothetical protein C4563_07445 [Desulfobulbus sp.]|jgi:hypothetical protein|nr:MAG: hypothetical protein C4563_07445 [Desulfobulbus sp.]
MKTLRLLLCLLNPAGYVLAALFFCGLPAAPVHAAAGDLLWAKGFGSTFNDEGYDIHVDAAGNVYTTGYFRGTADFDPGPGTVELSSVANSKDVFISKLDSSGGLVWARAIGGSSSDEGWGIVTDALGNVYTTGYFVGTVDFDPGAGSEPRTSEGSSDIFISKLDGNGNFVGAWTMGGTADDYGYGILVDGGGNIYTTGYFKNTVDFDPGQGTANLSSASVNVEDIFISKLDNNGTFVWAKTIGGTSADVGLGISLYSTGNVYLTGWFQGTVDFGAEQLTSAGGSRDIYVSKLDSSGNFLWSRAMGGISEDIGQAVAVDSMGNVLSTGWFIGTADFDPGAGIVNLVTDPLSASDIFVSKLDGDGNFLWARAMGGLAADVGYGIAVDGANNVFTTGGFNGTADFDPGAGTFNLVSAGAEDIFISKLTASGHLVWAGAMGGPSADYGFDLAASADGTVHATGVFQGAADFDPGAGALNLTSAGFEDIFVCKLAGPDPFPWNLFLPAIMNKAPRP